MLDKDFVSIDHVTEEEVAGLLALARDMKVVYKNSGRFDSMRGKVLAMIFAKPSLRTRVSFEVAAVQLGGHAMYITHAEVGLGKREAVCDAARVLSSMVDAIMIRTFAQKDVDELARFASIPVINGLTDRYHPCQALADLMTIDEAFGTLKDIKVAYVGDGNNVAHSLINGARKTGIHLTVITPEGFEPDSGIYGAAKEEIGERLSLTTDLVSGVQDAHVIYTDVWASMGQEDQRKERLERFKGYQVDTALLNHADSRVRVMHCLPAHRGEEITDDVMDGPHALMFEQAENRLHLQRALLHHLMRTR